MTESRVLYWKASDIPTYTHRERRKKKIKKGKREAEGTYVGDNPASRKTAVESSNLFKNNVFL